MLTLHNSQEVPPGGFRYFQKETGHWISSPSLDELISAVKKHRTANNLPVGTEFKAEVENQLCENCPPETCAQNETTKTTTQAGPISFKAALETASLLTNWFIRYGRKHVDVGLAEKRASICVQCPRNQPIQGCTTCNLGAVREAVVKIVGGRKTKHDSLLNACAICGCSLRAKIHLPIELLKEYLTPEKLAQFPQWCWVKEESQP